MEISFAAIEAINFWAFGFLEIADSGEVDSDDEEEDDDDDDVENGEYFFDRILFETPNKEILFFGPNIVDDYY